MILFKNKKGSANTIVSIVIGIIIGAAITVGLFLWKVNDNAIQQIPFANQNDKTQQELCLEAGGQWRQLGSTCVDNCGKETDMCGWALTMGCDCGASKCWDGSNCIPDKSARD